VIVIRGAANLLDAVTQGRLGSVNEFVHAIWFALEDRVDQSLHDLSLWLVDTPILPLKEIPSSHNFRHQEDR
jgi:hypothetical protein